MSNKYLFSCDSIRRLLAGFITSSLSAVTPIYDMQLKMIEDVMNICRASSV